LVTEEVIQFFDKHKFFVELSFDGLAQEVQRKKGSLKKIISLIKKLLSYPNIGLEVNSVFASKTVGHISDSIRFIMDLGVPNIRLSLSTIKSWNKESLSRLDNEMRKLRKIVFTHYKEKGNIPVTNFREIHEKGIFYCAAGKDRLTITPEEDIWGCYLFPDYFKGKENTADYKKICFGTLDNFIENHKDIYPRISSNHAQLSMDYFSTSKIECFLCSELEECAVCPINAAFSGFPLGKIALYICEIQKIKIREKEKFNKKLKQKEIEKKK